MNKFLTLIRRDMADNRGALIITPIVIAAVVLVLAAFGVLTGHSKFGFDPKDFKGEFSIDANDNGVVGQNGIARDAQGRVVITSPNGSKTLDQTIGAEGKQKIAVVMPMATSIVGMIPLGVVSIIVLFLLSGALYDERKDRTILFWKSMPVSDLANASAKMVSIILVGFAVAFLAGMVMQTGSVLLGSAGMTSVGITGIPLVGIFANVGLLWLVGLVAIITYIGWALPIYAWFLAVGSAAPKAPFIAAIVPLALAPAIAGILGLPGDIKIWLTPLRRLIGVQAFHNVTNGGISNLEQASRPLPIQETITEITSSMAEPAFWMGLVLAAALVYAASEIRRRRAL
jgi:ABC-2 type transport system permease protein